MAGFEFEQRPREADINAEFPHQVAFPLPRTGLVALLARMDNYCAMRSLSHRKQRDPRGRILYCFATQAHAKAFLNVFGGELAAVSAAGAKSRLADPTKGRADRSK